MPSLTSRAFSVIPEHLRWTLLGMQQRLHEPEVRVVREALRNGGTAVDVGGWWGPWTWWLSRSADRVVVLEPVPTLAAFLRRVTPDHVEVVEAAASSRAGDARLWVPAAGPGSEGRSSLVTPPPGSAPVEVRTVPVDDLDLTDVVLMKVDVEGHELDVLDGAEAVMARWHPTLVIELEQRFHDRPLPEIFAEVEARGYRGWFLDRRRWRPVAEFDVERWQTRDQARVDRAGYLSAARFRNRYRNNFVFHPSAPPPRAAAR